MDTDLLVIGAGVIGLSIAERMARVGHHVIVCEKEPRCGTGISSRNSEVIHAGIYYPPGTRKARHCVRGSRMLYEWLEKYSVPFRRVGKLIVAATDKEGVVLDRLHENARACGVTTLQHLEQNQIREIEPQLRAQSALFSPETGIFSVHDFITSLEMSLLKSGGTLATHSTVCEITYRNDYYIVEIEGPKGERASISSRSVVNAAGLNADLIASLAGLNVDKIGYRQHYCKGSYLTVVGGNGALSHLIYPVPDPSMSGLGIHVTIDLADELRLGPDAEWLHERIEEYSVCEDKITTYKDRVSRYWPSILDMTLLPSFSGIRPKVLRTGFADFIIKEESASGLPRFVNLMGMESPGLTSSLSIALEVEDLLLKK